jgi:predicted acylesterase/phospholipase RssA
MSKCALVLSGGGIKAFAFHLGVVLALEEAGFRRKVAREPRVTPSDLSIISTYIGSSAGACTAAACLAADRHQDMLSFLGLAPGPFPSLGWRNLFRPALSLSGLFYASGLEKYVREQLPINDFRELGPELYVVATQLNGARKVIFGPKDSSRDGRYDPYIGYYNDVPVADAIAASASVPGLFAPYRIRNRSSNEPIEYTDGEVRETLSVHVARDNDVDLVIVSNVWMPYHYDHKIGTISNRGFGAVLNQTVTQMIEQKIDRFRNEADRYRTMVQIVRDFSAKHDIVGPDVEALVDQVSAAMRFRDMEEIYISPDKYDTEFTLLNAWTFDKGILRAAYDYGHKRGRIATDAWLKARDRAGK